MCAQLSYKGRQEYDEVINHRLGGPPIIKKRVGRRTTQVERKLWVDAQLRNVSCNLVGRSLVLFVEFRKLKVDEPKAVEKLKWWGFNAQS
jgi:hypothetical protein